jgi:hypothetical protein
VVNPMAHAEQALFSLLDCLQAQIDDAVSKDLTQRPCIVAVMPGNSTVEDYCQGCGDENGQAWVQLMSIQNTATSGDEGGGLRGICAETLTATYVVGIVRGGQVWDPEDGLPDAEWHLRDVVPAMTDMKMAYNAIRCCSPKLTVGEYSPIGPDGGCIGGAWTATLELDVS